MDDTVNGRIYQAWLEHCSAFLPPPEWSRLPIDPNAYVGPADPPAALSALRAQFADEDLFAAGVAQRGPDGAIAVAPKLAQPSAPLLAWRRAPQAVPFELLTEAGLLVNPWLPAAATLEDGWTRSRVKAIPLVCVAFTLVDVILFRSLDIPAVTAQGLDHIGAAELDQLIGCFEIGRPQLGPDWSDDAEEPDPSATGESPTTARDDRAPPRLTEKCEMVLAPWSLLDLEHPSLDVAEAVMEDLRHLNDLLRFQTFEMFVWRPTANDRQTFHELYLRDVNSTDWLRRAVCESLDSSLTHIIPRESQPQLEPSEPPDLAAALGEYFEVCYGDPAAPASRQQKITAERHVARRLHEEFMSPVIRDAAATADPAERQMKLTLAHTAHAAHVQAMAILQKPARAIGNFCTNTAWREDLEAFVAISKHALDVYEALQSRRAPHIRRRIAPPTPNNRRLPPPDAGGADSGLAGS